VNVGPGLWIVIVVGALCLRIAMVQGVFAGYLYENAAHVLLPARMDALALGGFVALAARGPGEIARLARLTPSVIAACITGLAGIALWRGGLRLFDPVSLTLRQTTGGFGITPCMLAG